MAIVKALHDSVSGPQGEWNGDRLRSLCIPNIFFEYKQKSGDGSPMRASVSMKNLIKVFKKSHRESGLV
ncbi:MAG: hypothetical protein JWQ49_6018 [Edaphobacter sp.]|nr:hypothetical protein [Edaphobacter sp.]